MLLPMLDLARMLLTGKARQMGGGPCFCAGLPKKKKGGKINILMDSNESGWH